MKEGFDLERVIQCRQEQVVTWPQKIQFQNYAMDYDDCFPELIVILIIKYLKLLHKAFS